MNPDSHILLIGALLLALNALLYLVLYLLSKRNNEHEKDTSNHTPTADGDTLQRKSRDFRGIPAHFLGKVEPGSWLDHCIDQPERGNGFRQDQQLRIIRTHFGDIEREPKD